MMSKQTLSKLFKSPLLEEANPSAYYAIVIDNEIRAYGTLLELEKKFGQGTLDHAYKGMCHIIPFPAPAASGRLN